jgi:hypothetical protein
MLVPSCSIKDFGMCLSYLRLKYSLLLILSTCFLALLTSSGECPDKGVVDKVWFCRTILGINVKTVALPDDAKKDHKKSEDQPCGYHCCPQIRVEGTHENVPYLVKVCWTEER